MSEMFMLARYRPYWRREVLTVAVAVTVVLVLPPALWGGTWGLQGREIIIAASFTFVGILCAGLLLRPEHD